MSPSQFGFAAASERYGHARLALQLSYRVYLNAIGPPDSEATLAIVAYQGHTYGPIHSADTVTRATTLSAFRNDASPVDFRPPAAARRDDERLLELPPGLSLRIYSDLAVIEAEWRRFESVADCTAFQTFDWLATWYRHVGERKGIRPVIAVGRFGGGEIAFMLPLGVVPERWARRLCWLGQDLCDYNAPLLAPDFSQRVTPDRFLAALQELLAQIQCEPLLRHDWIEFEKMPQKIGTQINPFTYLNVTPNASGVHLTRLGDDWEKFYNGKRSSATRRRDRAKRRHMSEYGDIRFVTAADADDARRTLETLTEQKKPVADAQGNRRHLCPAGTPGVLSRPRVESKNAESGSHQPRGDRDCLRRGKSRHRFRRLLLPRAGELCGHRSGPLRTGRVSPARTHGARDQTGLEALRFHDRRRAIQTGMVRY